MKAVIIIAIAFILLIPVSVSLSYAQSDYVDYFYDEVEPGTSWVRGVGGGCIPSSFTQSVHIWRDVSGQASSWVTPQKLDWGFASPGECMDKKEWEYKVPKNTSPGIYTFEWIEQCTPKSISECNVRNIEKFEVTVIGSASSQSDLINSKDFDFNHRYPDIDIEYHDVTIQSGSSAEYDVPRYTVSNVYDRNDDKWDVHVWWEATGQASSWVTPGFLDYGVSTAGKEYPKWSFTIEVPENTRAGSYSFTWERHCVVVFQDQRVSCNLGFQRQFEIEVTPNNGGGCLIATATYGSELAPQVQQLRELRDNQLLNTKSGTTFINSFNDVYYSFSPIIADLERENPVFKEMVKVAITPMISSLSILNYVDMDSEVEVLGYGISLIILNVGMYIGIPAVVIMRIRK